MDYDRVILDRAINGFRIKWMSDAGIMMQTVLEEPEDVQSEAQSEAELARKLCCWLVEHYCLSGSKHDSHRISIGVEIRGD